LKFSDELQKLSCAWPPATAVSCSILIRVGGVISIAAIDVNRLVAMIVGASQHGLDDRSSTATTGIVTDLDVEFDVDATAAFGAQTLRRFGESIVNHKTSATFPQFYSSILRQLNNRTTVSNNTSSFYFSSVIISANFTVVLLEDYYCNATMFFVWTIEILDDDVFLPMMF